MAVPPTTEEIAEALLAFLVTTVSKIAPVVDSSLRPKDIDQVDRSQMPAVYLQQKIETYAYDPQGMRAIPPKKRLHFDAIVYVAEDQVPGSLATPALNAMKDAIDAALALDSIGRPQTLGNTVQYARIEGTVIYGQPWDNDGKAAMAIPIVVLRP